MEIELDEGEMPAMVPVPLYESHRIGKAKNSAGDSFGIYLGLDEKLTQQLRSLSLDERDVELDTNTSDRKRFGQGSYEEWYSKGRVPFALIHEGDGKLAALVFYGPKPLGRKSMKHLSPEDLLEEKIAATAPSAGGWHTIAFRSYPPFRGKGVMKDFARTSMEIYLRYFPDAHLWTGTQRENAASMALSEKLGFKVEDSMSEADWVTMVRE